MNTSKVAPLYSIQPKAPVAIKRMPSIIKNLLNEEVYVVKVDNYDRFITFSTITILLLTVIFYIWSSFMFKGVELKYISSQNEDTEKINKWYKSWKYIKFGINSIAVVCIGVQMVRRGLNPMNHILNNEDFKKLPESKRNEIRRITMVNK